jgi:uncharacterized protein YqjF (DUF2071 family)
MACSGLVTRALWLWVRVGAHNESEAPRGYFAGAIAQPTQLRKSGVIASKDEVIAIKEECSTLTSNGFEMVSGPTCNVLRHEFSARSEPS